MHTTNIFSTILYPMCAGLLYYKIPSSKSPPFTKVTWRMGAAALSPLSAPTVNNKEKGYTDFHPFHNNFSAWFPPQVRPVNLWVKPHQGTACRVSNIHRGSFARCNRQGPRTGGIDRYRNHHCANNIHPAPDSIHTPGQANSLRPETSNGGNIRPWARINFRQIRKICHIFYKVSFLWRSLCPFVEFGSRHRI
jgi:hypothetical protein